MKLRRTCAAILILISIGINFSGYSQERSIIPESQLPNPDFYGLYAVTPNGLLELKPGKVARLPIFGPDVEFIYYEQDVSEAAFLKLYKTPSSQEIEKREKKRRENTQQYKGMNDFIQQGMDNYDANAAALTGLPQGSVEVEIREKPITGKKDTVRLVSRNMLVPGSYQIGPGSNPALWRFFLVSGNAASIASTMPIAQVVSQSEDQLGGSKIKQDSVIAKQPDNDWQNTVIIAKGQGFEISHRELETAVAAKLAALKASDSSNIESPKDPWHLSQEESYYLQKQSLTNLIKTKLLVQKANPDEINLGRINALNQMSDMKSSFTTKYGFQWRLETLGTTENELLARFVQQQIAKLVVSRELGENRTPEDSEKYITKLWSESAVEIIDPKLK